MGNRAKQTTGDRLSFMCPGCDQYHTVVVGVGSGPRWGWNNDLVNPTLTPSVLVTWSEPSEVPEEFDDPSKDIEKRCHSFVRNGNIEFLTDCSHELAGKTVPLPELQED